MFGGFDYNTMAGAPPWPIVPELQKQDRVVQVPVDGPHFEDIDGLLVVLPSSLTQPQMDNLERYVLAGHPVLILTDPMPLFNLTLAPVIPAGADRNPFMSQGQPKPEPKGDVAAFMRKIGVNWAPNQVVWDAYNPHPDMTQLQPEVVFVGRNNETTEAFNDMYSASAGLQELVRPARQR